MQIDFKKQSGRWVDIDGDTKFKVEYPTLDQQDKIDELQYEVAFMDERLLMPISVKEREKILNNLKPRDKARVVIITRKLNRLHFKYQVKDWNLKGEDGNKVSCRLINNEIEDSLFETVAKNLSDENLNHIRLCLLNETEFVEADKKK